MIFSGNEVNPLGDLDELNWKRTVSLQCYENAFQYLSLLTSLDKAHEITERIIDSENRLFRKADDIIRVSAPISPRFDYIAVKNLENKILSKESIDPVLLVQAKDSSRVHVVDGYETLIALWHLQKDAVVACVLTAWEMP